MGGGLMIFRRVRFAAMLVAALFVAPFAQAGAPTALAVATALVDAFNDHDPVAMARLVTKDFELYYFDEHGVAGRALQGPEALMAEMKGYFAARPSVRAEIVGAVDGPVFVSFREQIVGGQSALAVYEVRNGLIRRVWYYPAEPGVTRDAP